MKVTVIRPSAVRGARLPNQPERIPCPECKPNQSEALHYSTYSDGRITRTLYVCPKKHVKETLEKFS